MRRHRLRLLLPRAPLHRLQLPQRPMLLRRTLPPPLDRRLTLRHRNALQALRRPTRRRNRRGGPQDRQWQSMLPPLNGRRRVRRAPPVHRVKQERPAMLRKPRSPPRRLLRPSSPLSQLRNARSSIDSASNNKRNCAHRLVGLVLRSLTSCAHSSVNSCSSCKHNRRRSVDRLCPTSRTCRRRTKTPRGERRKSRPRSRRTRPGKAVSARHLRRVARRHAPKLFRTGRPGISGDALHS